MIGMSGMMLLQLGNDHGPARSGQVDVGDDQRRCGRVHGRKSRVSIVGRADAVSRGLEPLGDGFAHDCVVLDDEDVGGCGHVLYQGVC